MYRGYDIAELAERSTYEETALLLLDGDVASSGALEAFRRELADLRELPAETEEAIDRQAREAAPMDVLRTAVSTLRETTPAQLISQLPTIVARYHRRREGLEPVAPDASLTYSENFLSMLHGSRPSERDARAFDVAMILHAEHELNASTFAARVVAGTGADLRLRWSPRSPPSAGLCTAARTRRQWPCSSESARQIALRATCGKHSSGVKGSTGSAIRSTAPTTPRPDPQARLAGALRGRRRAELVRDHRGDRAHRLRGKGPLPERRPLLGLGLPLPRRPERPLHAALRRQPRRGLVGARARAAGRQQDHPALSRVRRRASPRIPLTDAELALEARAVAAVAVGPARERHAPADAAPEGEAGALVHRLPAQMEVVPLAVVVDREPVAARGNGGTAQHDRPARLDEHAQLPHRCRRRRRRRRGRVRDEELAVHRLPVRLARVGVARVVPKGDREGLLADELQLGPGSRRSGPRCSPSGSCGARTGLRRGRCTSRARIRDTFLPEASFRVMVKPSFVPTIAVNVGVSARRAAAGRTSTSAQMMTIPVRRTRPTAAQTVGAGRLRSTS